MKTRDAALKRYYRTIRNYIPCSRKMKNKILNEIRGIINTYLEENPDVEYEEIEARFGSPQQIAATYVDNLNTEELLHNLWIRKKVTVILVGAVIVALLFWAIGITCSAIDFANQYPGTIVHTITEIPEP